MVQCPGECFTSSPDSNPYTAKRRRVEVMRNEGGSATPSLTSAEEDVLQHKDNRLRVEVLPGGACIEPLTGSESSFISGRCT